MKRFRCVMMRKDGTYLCVSSDDKDEAVSATDKYVRWDKTGLVWAIVVDSLHQQVVYELEPE